MGKSIRRYEITDSEWERLKPYFEQEKEYLLQNLLELLDVHYLQWNPNGTQISTFHWANSLRLD